MDTLLFWHPSRDIALPAGALNWAPAAPRSAADAAFRLRNASTSYTAVDVTVSLTAVGTAASPNQAAQHLLSVDGGQIFTAEAALGRLSPLMVSGLITLRRVTPSTASTGTYTVRLHATAASWT